MARMDANHRLLPGLLITLCTLLAGPAQAQTYLDEVLGRPAHRKAWQAMLAGEHKLDPWLAGYARRRNGTTTPASVVQLDQVQYELHGVCELHNCEANRFYVLFAPDGRRAWGYQVRDDRQERFFGKPGPALKEVLRAAARS